MSALAWLLYGIELYLDGCVYNMATAALEYCRPVEPVFHCDPMWGVEC